MYGRAWPLQAPVKDWFVPTWPQLLAPRMFPTQSKDSSSRVMRFLQLYHLETTSLYLDDEVATSWLNNKAVRKALHAEETSEPWALCTEKVMYSHDAGSMIKYHRNLTEEGYRALIFSGDHDMCVPYTRSQASTKSLGYKIVDSWRPWFFKDQVAGYKQGYDKNLTFLTIKGSGHTVLEYKPQEAVHFYTRFLAGKKI